MVKNGNKEMFVEFESTRKLTSDLYFKENSKLETNDTELKWNIWLMTTSTQQPSSFCLVVSEKSMKQLNLHVSPAL